MNYVLVTGASTGLGEQMCRCLTAHGYQVLAGVRRDEDGKRLGDLFGKSIHPLLLDVTDETQVIAAYKKATDIVGPDPVVAIINNAGIVVNGAVLYIPVAEWHRQFEVNLYGVIRVTSAFFPLLAAQRSPGDDHPRRIINMSSVSGLFASPFLGPYAASKFALEGMSDALRRELYMYDIQVVLLEPANIRTPIWSKAKQGVTWFGPEYEPIRSFKDRIIDRNVESGYAPEILDAYIMKAVAGRKVRARYIVQRQVWKFRLIRMLPTKWIDRMIRKRLQAGAIRPF